jgi:putative ABC transport system permease protein
MFKNYLLEMLRNIKKYKGFSFINISGLSFGIACFILILMWVQDEISFDRFHENGGEIFRVIAKNQVAEEEIHSARTPNALGAVLENEFPEIINFTRTQGVVNWPVQYGEKKFQNDTIAMSDPAFFEMFTFHFIKGNPKTVFNDDYSLVVTERFAKKYFGDENPMNKIVNISRKDFKVSGVIKNVPLNSHIWFDCIFPINNMSGFWGVNLEGWKGYSPFYTYIQLLKNSSWKDVSKKISGIVKKYSPGANMDVYLQPLKDIHLKSKFKGDLDNYQQGNITNIYLLSTIALCILFIACFNSMNLSTARSGDRAKGIAIRKVVGAKRMDIMKQFLGEAIVLSFIALILAVILVYFLLPLFNDLSGKQLKIIFLGRWQFVLALTSLVVVIGVISGSYPAFLLSSFKPINILKGPSGTTPKKRGAYLRKILVTIQFVTAAILIGGTIVVYTQMNFIRTKDLGFNPHNVFNFYTFSQIEKNFEERKALFMANPNVLNFSLVRTPMSMIEPETDDVNWEGKNPDEKITVFPSHIDYGYIELYQMKMIEGRSFSKKFSTDTSAFILNETAVKEMALKAPVGKRFWINGREGTIIGVVKDYHHRSLHGKIIPAVLMLPFEHGFANIRISPVNQEETLRFIKNTFNKINRSPYTFNGNFVDETIADLYKSEQKIGTIAQVSTLITLFISCLGLFGLSVYATKQKTKEIGIRKISGASVSGIVWLISKEFMKWIIIAFIFAYPLAWFIMNRWLENFAYRINVEWWMFAFTTVAVLTIAFFTISYQVIKAARTNPVDSLRYE